MPGIPRCSEEGTVDGMSMVVTSKFIKMHHVTSSCAPRRSIGVVKGQVPVDLLPCAGNHVVGKCPGCEGVVQVGHRQRPCNVRINQVRPESRTSKVRNEG
jgi:hypothetical protein